MPTLASCCFVREQTVLFPSLPENQEQITVPNEIVTIDF